MDSDTLHIVMLPWLAMGHLLPFLELSKRLARQGHHISLLTTPKNIERLLPNVPPSLSPLLHLVELRMPIIDQLPASVENTTDLPSDDLRPYLTVAYDTFEEQLSSFLQHAPDPRPDWIIYDFAAVGWAPGVAAAYGIPSNFLSLFNAAILTFFWSNDSAKARTLPEDFTKVPDWIPFPTTIAYRPHEARELFKHMAASGGSQPSKKLDESSFVAIRSCKEFEQDWIELLSQLYKRPVIPVGLLPPSVQEGAHNEWADTMDWLDQREPRSVVYVAFGSEVKLTCAQVHEIAVGLELSRLPFVWALRAAGALPEGFVGRTEGQGLVCEGWVPQDRLLGHAAVGGFLTHGGWNSIVEGLSFGVAVVVLPFLFDQGLNARILVERGIGVEVRRNEEDGSFSGEGIAESLRLVMVEEEGGCFRAKARECKDIFGDEELQDRCVGEFVKYFLDQRERNNSNGI